MALLQKPFFFLAPALIVALMVSPVNGQCDFFDFCDRDGDGFVRDHKRCTSCGGEIDCDDQDRDLTTDCSGTDPGAGGVERRFEARLLGNGDDFPPSPPIARESCSTDGPFVHMREGPDIDLVETREVTSWLDDQAFGLGCTVLDKQDNEQFQFYLQG